MKNALLCVVILITCSGHANGDLELYPDYQRSDVPDEEWAKDDTLNQDFRNYLEEHKSSLFQQSRAGFPYLDLYKPKQPDMTWPGVAAQALLNKEALARKIAELTRNVAESNRRPQYYFKTHGMSREQQNRYNLFNTFDDSSSASFVPRFKPNFRILDDVRLNPNSDTDFSLPGDDVDMGDERIDGLDEESVEALDDTFFEEKTPDDVKAVANDPSEFAYPPSDPRYFEGLPEEVKSPIREKNVETSDFDFNTEPVEVSTRKEEGNYEGTPVLPLKGYARRPDDNLDVVAVKPQQGDDTTGVYIIAIVAGISAAATVGLIAFGIGWYNLQKHVKNASDAEYPAYGVTGPNKDISPSGDRRLAQSAQMYHYQHQKQQIIAMERAAASERHGSASEADSDEENEEGDYTVYECPGLAPTGEMEVKNPLFQDDPTPAQTPALKVSEDVARKE